jgi:MoaA/NifB/PqqE/SkfB family radical SAM enzyme
VDAKFSAVLRGIRSLVAAASNLHELPRLVELAAEVGARNLHVEPLYSQIQHDLQEHYARENLGILGPRRVDELFQQARRRAEDLDVRLASRFLADTGSADYVETARGSPRDGEQGVHRTPI